MEEAKCKAYHEKQSELIEVTMQDIAYANANAANARRKILSAQAAIQGIEVKLPQTTEELEGHNHQCTADEEALKQQLSVVMGDIAVLTNILNLIECDSASSSGATTLLLCKKRVKFAHPLLQAQISKLVPLNPSSNKNRFFCC